MADRIWTKDQQSAISARGGAVLVSAAAGSGKTAVLVERVIRRMADRENPCDADRFLIVTFSNAAAAEMKERIGNALADLMKQDPRNAWLQHQRILLDNAPISTIHSFCMRLLRENFQQAGLSVDFRVGDQSELAVLKAEALAEVVENYYAKEDDGAFFDLVELLSGSRDDKKLTSVIDRLYNFILSHPFPEKWLDQKLALYDPQVPVEQSVWGKVILSYAESSFCYCLDLLNRAISEMAGDDALQKAYLPAFESDSAFIGRLLENVRQGEWDNICTRLNSMTFDRLGSLRKYEDTEKSDRMKALRDEIKTTLTYVKDKVFCASAVEFSEDIADLKPKIACLFKIVRDFDVAFSQKKREHNLVDFQDLEHFALKLLVAPSENGYIRTAKAEEIAQGFEEILLDEYQDTNEAQDMIFRAVSKNEKNLFMVGDVKQSIYRFRQAMPEIFIRQKNVFTDYDGERFPAKILLSRNFRSREGITRGINYLFSRLMSEDVGEIIYDEPEYLNCGAGYPPGNSPDVGLTLIDLGQNEDGEDKLVLEARYIARKIAGMMKDGFTVYEKGTSRPARYSDFCILLRSVQNKADVFANELSANGIPCYAESTADFLQTAEIRVIVSFLRALNNPLLDIPLLSVLMSPLFGFCPDDAAAVRMAAGKKNLYHGLAILAADGNEKCAAFLNLFGELRKKAAVLTTDRLISEIYGQTDMPAIFSVMKSGAERELNLYRFEEYAARYESTGYHGLQGFVRFIDNVMETGGGFSSFAAGGGEGVRIMSIHRSKGLEFPVCFLADTAKRFNKEDLRGATAIHSELGFACVRREPERTREYTTINREAVMLELERAMLSEELRVLYVALTRAKEKLFITLSLDNIGRRLAKIAGMSGQGERVPPFLVRRLNSYAEWILAAVLHHKDAGVLREWSGLKSESLSGDFDMDVEIVNPEKAGEENPAPEDLPTVQPDSALLDALQKRVDFRYPFAASTEIPSKLSVSQIAKQSQDSGGGFSKKPMFLSGESLSAAQKGTAIHTFMQYADYALAEQDAEREIERLRVLKYLTAEEAENVSGGKLRAFFSSMLYRRMKNAQKLYRELKFFTSIEASEYTGKSNGSRERIVVQGIADCVFIENGKAILVDYKSDKAYNENVLIDRYQPQLLLYKKAIEEGLSVPVAQCILYSFEMGKGIVL